MGTRPSSDTEFSIGWAPIRLRFEPIATGKVAQRVILQEGDQEFSGPRIELPTLTPEQLSGYTGNYYSGELSVVYTVFLRGGKLMVRYPRGEAPLEPVQPDEFIAGHPMGRVRFTRRTMGQAVDGFTLNNGRVRNLSFARTEAGVLSLTVGGADPMTHYE